MPRLDDKVHIAQTRSTMTITTPEQIRAGRIMLKWHQADLAAASGLHLHTIKLAENGSRIRPSTALAIELAFEHAGLILVDRDANGGPGVRLKA